ncbi:MAG: DUF2190 family protein [Acidobacteria bacterium]|jgi:predicted RecA/RadA family phage recombinase|nr:DUF2190 family protein [Acidobacteriota bacterium]
MKNFIQDGNTLTIAAPSGGVTSGQFVVQGRLVGVASAAAAQGASVAIVTEGVFTLAKVTTDVVTLGEALYWDSSVSKLTDTPGTNSKPLVGYAVEAAGNGATTVKCRVVPTVQIGPSA